LRMNLIAGEAATPVAILALTASVSKRFQQPPRIAG
jgi:hypothetical protein